MGIITTIVSTAFEKGRFVTGKVGVISFICALPIVIVSTIFTARRCSK